MSTYLKEFLSIVEIENKICQRCSKLNIPVELVYDKLIVYIEGSPTYNLPRKMYHPKCTILTKDTAVLDVILQIYFKESFLEDVICNSFSSGGSKSIKLTFAVSKYLKKPPSVLNILFQRVNYDMPNYVAKKMNLKLLYLLNICTNNHQVMRIYNTP